MSSKQPQPRRLGVEDRLRDCYGDHPASIEAPRRAAPPRLTNRWRTVPMSMFAPRLCLPPATSTVPQRAASIQTPRTDFGRPPILRTLVSAHKAGITRAEVVLGYEADSLRRVIEGHAPNGLAVHFSYNPEWQLENGVSVLAARNRLRTSRFALLMGDIFSRRRRWRACSANRSKRVSPRWPSTHALLFQKWRRRRPRCA